jgi:hypothetical protein
VTTLAILPASLKELFDRIDAATASAEHLKPALEHWMTERRSGVFPTLAAMAAAPVPFSPDIFIFERTKGAKPGWRLRRAGDAARALLEPRGDQLAEFGNRQIAQRLGRLFDWVSETGEPVAADFELDGTRRPAVWCEVLAAPLSADGKTVTGIFGGLLARPETGGR